MSVTVMRHICFIECPYHKSIPPTGKLAMPNFPHYQKKKPAIKLNPMNFFTINITSNKRQSCFYIQLIHLPQNSSTLEKIMAASDWRKELLCKHDSWHRGSCCGLDLPVSGFTPGLSGDPKGPFRWPECFRKPFRFRLSAFRGAFRKTCFIGFDYKMENEEL